MRDVRLGGGSVRREDAVTQVRVGGNEACESACRIEGGEDGLVAVVENPAVTLRGGLL